MDDVNAEVIDEFRANGGSVGGALAGVSLLLLTHRGARSGVSRTTPLGYYEDGERLILFASNRGAARAPDWYHNIVADPRVTVELGEETFEAEASELVGPDREATWERAVAVRPFLAEHQEKAGRQIPLIAVRLV
ncbi:nitroreductase family deazaflavin-dependent oxidoreductase [Actinotalea fermentans]|uniref:Nitroreductase n=1 Tax=Actinotalea fermentans TaxID=43671 RepID=A0A511Z247_9CELL|nr:nitroreductase family deazaflavin-dependent oxidoreductase [Actinotalea fermentans]KGM17495.1 hypothetical protein N867_02445 [Actinotalea fermentans ATCC 43279 = JCM 9966 = DSM 3133]GEN81466.1 hypothetical protein AFE02nite_32000 [Actinotalea fermentans]